MRELLIGCGNKRKKRIDLTGPEWDELVTLDIREDCGADVIWDLNNIPLPFDDESFDAIHAYEVLEHVGKQGDYEFFFAQFSDFWRILKPGGVVVGSVPRWDGVWAWGDPSHTRVLAPGTFSFLSQEIYERDVGLTNMTDFRGIYKVNFAVSGHVPEGSESFYFALGKC